MADTQHDYETHHFTHGKIIHAECMEWLSCQPESSIHAIVTDPPYGLREYKLSELKKLGSGDGGI
jgi:site-specific DNA-methyltransferase (adenine-specific)